MELETDAFRLRLDTDWVQFPGDGPNQYQFWSEQKGSSVIISYVQATIPRDKRLAGATTMLEAHKGAAREQGELDIGDSRIKEEADSEVVHCAYAGSNGGVIFRYCGWVTEGKFLNFYVSTETQDHGYSQLVFDEVFGGFEFWVP